MFMGCPLTWVSKLQTQIALNTMEVEYIALSQSMRELIAIREVLREIQTYIISGKFKKYYLEYTLGHLHLKLSLNPLFTKTMNLA